MGIPPLSFYAPAAPPGAPLPPPPPHKVTRVYSSRKKPRLSLPAAARRPLLAGRQRPQPAEQAAPTAHTQHSRTTRLSLAQQKRLAGPSVVEVIDLTRDDSDIDVIDLTGDSDSDDAPQRNKGIRFPLKDLPIDELVLVLDSLSLNEVQTYAKLDTILVLFQQDVNSRPRKRIKKNAFVPPDPLPLENCEANTIKSAIALKFNASNCETHPITEISNNPVTPGLLVSMIRPSTWLSDETINAFMAALQLAHPHIKFFNTFFYSVLCGSAGRRSREGYNYEGVRRWTKKQTRSGIFEFESVVIPINKGNSHWCFAVICFKESRISFMDSLAGSTTFAKKVLQNLKRYLCDEWQEKVVSNQQQITLSNIRDIDSFELIEKVSGCPQQSDGSSCGVFVCYFAYCIARGEDVSRLPFNQKEADCFRKGIAYTLTLPLLILTSE